MKGYKVPSPLVTGICFVCGDPCKEGHYVHQVCAIGFAAAKEEKIKQSKVEPD